MCPSLKLTAALLSGIAELLQDGIVVSICLEYEVRTDVLWVGWNRASRVFYCETSMDLVMRPISSF